MAGPGDLAEGLLPVWGSDEATVRSVEPCSSVPSESGVRLPPATATAGGAGSRGPPGRRASESNC